MSTTEANSSNNNTKELLSNYRVFILKQLLGQLTKIKNNNRDEISKGQTDKNYT